MMRSTIIKSVFLIFAVTHIYAQSVEREQGLITLEPFWRQALGGEVLSLPHVQAQSAVVALDGGNIRAYSTAGTPLWNFSARGRIAPYVSRSREGTTYFSRTNGTLIALNRAGRELWQRDVGSPLSSRVVIGWDGRLFVPVDRHIFCFTASGTLLWSRAFDSPFTIAPVLDRGGGIIFSIRNEVYRIDPFGNTDMWQLANTPVDLVSVTDSTGQRIVAFYHDGTMEILGSSHADDWFLGAQIEVNPIGLPRLPSRPLAAAGFGGYIAAVLSDGRVTLISLDERRILWTGDSHIRNRQDTAAEMIFDHRGIYVLSLSGATSFSHDGRRLWITYLQNAATIPAFGDDGVLYSGGRNWILYAFRIEDTNPPQRNILFGRVQEGSYNLGRPQPGFAPSVPYFENEILSRLHQITTAVNAGRVGGNEPAWTTFLLNLAANSGSPGNSGNPGNLVNSGLPGNLIFRIAAIDLLGRIGSGDTIPWLLNILNRETEPTVRAAAIRAIGDIGVDPEGIALRTFFNMVIYNQSSNEQVLTAIASATGAICRFSGPPLSQIGVRILTMLTASNQPPMVRRQANMELLTLR